MTSSLSTVLQQLEQSNYNTANTFLEAFCQYRHSLGLPASVLHVCPIEDVGYVADNSHARQKLKSQGHWFLDEGALLAFLELAIRNSIPRRVVTVKESEYPSPNRPWVNSSQIVLGLRSELPLDDPANRAIWRRDRRMGAYHNVVRQDKGQAVGGASGLREFLDRAANRPDVMNKEKSQDYLAHEIGKKILSFFAGPVDELDLSQTLTQVGLDSLMAIELRRWWRQVFGFEISVLEIMSSGTVSELGRVAAKGVAAVLAESL